MFTKSFSWIMVAGEGGDCPRQKPPEKNFLGCRIMGHGPMYKTYYK